MQRSAVFSVLLIGTIVQADDLIVRRQPSVVYEGHSTVTAQTYYQRLESRSTSNESGNAPPVAGIIALEQQLPITPKLLRVGKPAMRVQEGQVIPLFIMGMDQVSLDWFSRSANGLAQIGARGVVVQASRLGDWRALHKQAQNLGIDLMLLAGDSLAEGYQIDTYPVVIVSPELVQAGRRE